MIKTTVQVSGMTCGMCEAHINDAVRSAFYVKKVTSSRARGTTEILTETPLSHEKLRQAIGATGYVVLGIREEIVQKKPLFGFLRGRNN